MRTLIIVILVLCIVIVVLEVADHDAEEVALPDLPPIHCPDCGMLIYPPSTGIRPGHLRPDAY